MVYLECKCPSREKCLLGVQTLLCCSAINIPLSLVRRERNDLVIEDLAGADTGGVAGGRVGDDSGVFAVALVVVPLNEVSVGVAAV